MLRKLIVNADDFGLTPGVSRGILAAHRHGIVTSSTVLVTGDVEKPLLAEARDQGLKLGLHVNFTLGKPLTHGGSLVGSDGRFVRDARLVTSRDEPRYGERVVDAHIALCLTLVMPSPS